MSSLHPPTAVRRVPSAPPTIVAVCSYAIMAGFFTQSGVILGPAAAYFGRTATATAGAFAFLLGGNLVGIIVSLGIFARCSIRTTFIGAYAVLIAGVIVTATAHAYAYATAGIALVGFGGGLGLSAGAVIIARIYSANRRAIAFLCTDCAFSVAGFIVPAVTGVALARGFGWSAGYVIVGGCAALLAACAAAVRFPPLGMPAKRPGSASSVRTANVIARVMLFAAALASYLAGQSAFLIWAPSAARAAFGLAPLAAGNIVSGFWGPSIFGLIAAALLSTRIAPRAVLLAAGTLAVGCLCAIVTAADASRFVAATAGFGFSSTCMYKLMISIGSEQVATPPPSLVTLLLLAGSVGGTASPVASAALVHAAGPRAGPALALACYLAALLFVGTALALERGRVRVPRAVSP